jgi:hypothetical protein
MACNGDRSGAYIILVRCERKRQLGIPGHRWEDNIKPLAPEFFFKI